MSYQRIKTGGKSYAAGEPIELTKEELAELPDGAVSETEVVELSEAEKTDALGKAVADLSVDVFKNDGGIRADALRALISTVGFEVTVQEVSDARKESEA